MYDKNQILDKISKDLNIFRYGDEDLRLYKSRVVYSALSNWVKISTLDIDNLNDSQEVRGQSQKYIFNKVSIFLDNMIEIFPEINDWFYPEDIKEKPETIVIDRLKKSGEIIKSGFNSYLALPEYEECVIDNKIKSTRGIDSNYMQIYSGLTMLKQSEEDLEIDQLRIFDFYGVENITANEILNVYIKYVQWKKE